MMSLSEDIEMEDERKRPEKSHCYRERTLFCSKPVWERWKVYRFTAQLTNSSQLIEKLLDTWYVYNNLDEQRCTRKFHLAMRTHQEVDDAHTNGWPVIEVKTEMDSGSDTEIETQVEEDLKITNSVSDVNCNPADIVAHETNDSEPGVENFLEEQKCHESKNEIHKNKNNYACFNILNRDETENRRSDVNMCRPEAGFAISQMQRPEQHSKVAPIERTEPCYRVALSQRSVPRFKVDLSQRNKQNVRTFSVQRTEMGFNIGTVQTSKPKLKIIVLPRTEPSLGITQILRTEPGKGITGILGINPGTMQTTKSGLRIQLRRNQTGFGSDSMQQAELEENIAKTEPGLETVSEQDLASTEKDSALPKFTIGHMQRTEPALAASELQKMKKAETSGQTSNVTLPGKQLIKIKDITRGKRPFHSSKFYNAKKCELEEASDSDDSFDDMPDYLPEIKKKKPESPWIKVNLDDHKDKYTVEVFESFSRKDRGNNVTEELFCCLVCKQFKCAARDKIEEHIEKHVNKTLECRVCDFIACREKDLNDHRNETGHEHKTKYVCELCGVILYRIDRKKHHMGKVHNVAQFKCKFCPQLLTSDQKRVHHTRSEHKEECQYCPSCRKMKNTLSKSDFKKHLDTCKTSRQHQCQICGLTFKLDVFRRHMQDKHLGVRQFKCDVCPYTAKTSKRLQTHVLSHSGTHPYSCELCSFTCVQSTQLKCHMRTHSGEKPFKCTICKYAAGWNVQLKDHLKVHTMETAFMCEQCDIMFKNQKCLNLHLKKDHVGKAGPGKNALAYRPMYGALGELRSLAGPKIPVIALTATASIHIRNMIKYDLCMNENVFELIINPNKTNIKFWVIETKRSRGDITKDFDWLVDLIRKEGINTPRMIIFFRKIDHIADVYEHLETSLGKRGYLNYEQNKINDDRNRLFDMFHLKTDDEVKESITNSYQDPTGHTRVVLCSTSFSMGLNVKGVDTVIHYGSCNDLDDFLQETGRAGRQADDKCHSIVMKYKQCLSSKNITQNMKDFVNATTCRRKLLLKPFTDETIEQEGHNCCDICAVNCACLCLCNEGKTCDCSVKCPSNTSKVYNRIIQFIENEIDIDDDNSNSEGFDTDSDIDEHISRKPCIVDYSSDYE